MRERRLHIWHDHIGQTRRKPLEPMSRPVSAVVRLHNVSWKFAGPPRTSAKDPAQHFFLFAGTGGCTRSKDSSAQSQGTFFFSLLAFLRFKRNSARSPPGSMYAEAWDPPATLGRKCLIPFITLTYTSKRCTISRSVASMVCVALIFMFPERAN